MTRKDNLIKNKKITHKFLLAVIVSSFINIFALGTWIVFKITPLVPIINNLKEEITEKKLKNVYETYDLLIEDINNISKNYDVSFQIEDVYGNKISDVKVDTDFNLATDMVKAGEETYLLKIYSKRGLGFYKLVSQLVLFQIVVLSIVLVVFFGYTRRNIIKPIYTLIEDIRNYKFGHKPKRKRVQNEFDLINNEFVSLTEKLDLEKEEQRRIIASISHDIKTPLTSIIGYSELISETTLEEDAKKYVNKITRKAGHIKELLSSFDDYLFNQEKITLKLDQVKISEIVGDLYNDYLVELENKHIKFDVKTDIKESIINVDILKLKRILSNMISNSIKYLTNIEDAKITIYISKDENNYLFKVSDNGPGVRKDILDKIFYPLFTTDNSRKVSGLGLSICKTFVELHKGEIKAYNNSGLTIEFTIPYK